MKLFIEISTSNRYPAEEIDNILNEEFYKIYWNVDDDLRKGLYFCLPEKLKKIQWRTMTEILKHNKSI